MINKTRPQYLIAIYNRINVLGIHVKHLSTLSELLYGKVAQCYINNAYDAFTELHIDSNNRSPHSTSHPRNYQSHLKSRLALYPLFPPDVSFSFLSPERDGLRMSSPL